MTTTTLSESNQVKSGIILIIVALALAALTGALMKLLTEDMSPLLIGWFRFTGYLVIMMPIALMRVGRQAFKPPRMKIQVLRGALMVVGNVSFMLGVTALDYADAIAILYIYPFLMTLWAPWILGERVGLVGWLGVLGGFAGVLVVIRPDFGGIDAHALFVLGTGVMVALQMLLNRKLGMLSDPAVIAMWGSGVASIILLVAVPFTWVPITMEHVGIIILMAFTSAASQTMMILAMTRAPAGTLAPFTYSEIVAAILIGLILFGTLPDALSWAGIGLIVLSGVLVARAQGRTTLRRQPKI